MAKTRVERQKPSHKQRRDRSQQPTRLAMRVAAELLEEGDAKAAVALLEPLVAQYPGITWTGARTIYQQVFRMPLTSASRGGVGDTPSAKSFFQRVSRKSFK